MPCRGGHCMAKIGKNNWVNKFGSNWKYSEQELHRHGQCSVHAVEKINIIFVTFLFMAAAGKKRENSSVRKSHRQPCQQQTMRAWRATSEWSRVKWEHRIWKCYHKMNFNEKHFQLMENENEKKSEAESERRVNEWMVGWFNGMGREIEIIHHIINHNREWSEPFGRSEALWLKLFSRMHR